VIAGIVTAVVAKSRARVALPVVGGLLLVTGIGVQAEAWNLMPLSGPGGRCILRPGHPSSMFPQLRWNDRRIGLDPRGR
jgi:hypothetical protein